MPYRFNSKHAYLTYNNVHLLDIENWTPNSALQVIHSNLSIVKSAGKEPCAVSVCIEKYPSRLLEVPLPYHAHVLLTWESNVNHKLEDFYINGIACDREPCGYSEKDLKAIIKYLKKDGLFEIGHTFVEKETIADKWRPALQCRTRAEASKYLQEHFPDKFILNYGNVQSFLNAYYSGTNEVYETPGAYDFALPQSLVDWKETEFIKVSEKGHVVKTALFRQGFRRD